MHDTAAMQKNEYANNRLMWQSAMYFLAIVDDSCMGTGLCASVLRGPGQSAMAAVSASTTASTFGAGVAESFMEMSCLPEGQSLACAKLHAQHLSCLICCYAARCIPLVCSDFAKFPA